MCYYQVMKQTVALLESNKLLLCHKFAFSLPVEWTGKEKANLYCTLHETNIVLILVVLYYINNIVHCIKHQYNTFLLQCLKNKKMYINKWCAAANTILYSKCDDLPEAQEE